MGGDGLGRSDPSLAKSCKISKRAGLLCGNLSAFEARVARQWAAWQRVSMDCSRLKSPPARLPLSTM